MSLPASAFEGDTEPPVGDTGEDLVGDIGSQIDTLNNGRRWGGGPPAPSCEWTEGSGDDAVERDDGELRWRLTVNEQHVWGHIEGENIDEGTFYRYECWHPDMECGDPKWGGDDGCYGDISYDGCGELVCFFDAISPNYLALYAVDGFVENLPAPEPRFSPDGGTTYVNLDTWMWLDDVPGGGQIGPIPMAVPGITVSTTASLDSVEWEMGDGEGTVFCPLTTNEASAESECNYNYHRSSANQPDLSYAGTASTVWLAEWEVAEFPMSGEIEAPRATDFSLQVAEIQTVVTLNEQE